jgi:glycosyltransferase involved in cell wall biosynthesis
MQEIKKRRIVIASVLKPVDDTRMFEKMGQSLAPLYEVHIIGYPAGATPVSRGIMFHSLPKFSRLSLKRAIAPWQILRIILQLKPAIVIFTTHELLVVAVLAKLLLRCRMLYDVMENYGRNILHTNAFPLLLRPFLAAWVRLKEWITAPLIDHFILAEAGYQHELKFPGKHTTIIENKFKKPSAIRPQREANKNGTIQLLFSGTISDSTGVFIAIDLADKLHARRPEIRLTIIGYCALPGTLTRLRAAISTRSFIRLIGGHQLVPHHDILKAIQNADYGIISYPPNPSTTNSIPTKLYEYLGSHLPILLIHHTPWTDLCSPYPAAIPFQADHIDPEKILHRMTSTNFYDILPENVYWEHEEQKLLHLLSQFS